MPDSSGPSAIYKNDHTFAYEGRSIDYTIWSNTRRELHTLVFLGNVQVNELPRWVLEACPTGSAVVQGAPHWFAKADGSDLASFMRGFTRAAMDEVLAAYQPAGLHVVAESQTVPTVIRLMQQPRYSRYLSQLTLLQPLGLNSSAFGTTPRQRVQTFQRRVAANALHQLTSLMTDRRLRYNHRLLAKMVDFRSPAARAQYASGLAHDSGPELAALFKTHPDITIICGGNDKVFPPSEVQATLNQHDVLITVQVVKGVPHSPLGTRLGRRLLGAAFRTLQ